MSFPFLKQAKTQILRGVYPELAEGLRMTNWKYLVILRTEGTKNLGFALLPLLRRGPGGFFLLLL